MSSEPAKHAKPERERRFVLSAIPPAATDPREILDLSRDEYDVFAALPHHALSKTRHGIALADRTLSVDAFHDVLEGLVLAEVDLGNEDSQRPPFEPPPYCIAEVSRNERFTGGRLAVTDRATMVGAFEQVSGLHLPH